MAKPTTIKWQKWENAPNFLQLTQGARAPHSEESRVLRCCWEKRDRKQWNNGNLSNVHDLSCKRVSCSLKRCWKVPIFSCDVRHDVLVKELENERDAIGKHQMLSHVLKLWKQAHKDKFDHLIRMTGWLKHNFNIWENLWYTELGSHKCVLYLPGRCGSVWSVSEAAAGWQRSPSRWSLCVDWHQHQVSCFATL